MMEWFCAMSEPRREMVAEEALRELDVADVYLPRYTRSVVRSRRVVERVEPLFPAICSFWSIGLGNRCTICARRTGCASS
jgi:hypothetical protein